MNETLLKQLDEIFGTLISAYEKMGELYEQKKEALVHRNLDVLNATDDKIVEQYEYIKELDVTRKNLVAVTGREDIKVTEVIDYCKETENDMLEIFENYKVKICEVRDRLALLEQINVELINHGLIMSNNVLNIVVSACSVQAGTYDKQGKNSYSESLGVSSVCEDA